MSNNYPLRAFQFDNPDMLHKTMRTFPLATVISQTSKHPHITLLPLMTNTVCEGQFELIGHLDRNNPHAEFLVAGASVSFVFQGPNTYASPDLYEDRQLPGWLYVMVQGQGIVTKRLDGESTVAMLVEAGKRFSDSEQTFKLESSDPRIDALISGIIAFQIQVKNITGVAKLAQDKGKDHAKIASTYLANTQSTSPINLFEELIQKPSISNNHKPGSL